MWILCTWFNDWKNLAKKEREHWDYRHIYKVVYKLPLNNLSESLGVKEKAKARQTALKELTPAHAESIKTDTDP